MQSVGVEIGSVYIDICTHAIVITTRHPVAGIEYQTTCTGKTSFMTTGISTCTNKRPLLRVYLDTVR
jgi:hypothetical protein